MMATTSDYVPGTGAPLDVESLCVQTVTVANDSYMVGGEGEPCSGDSLLHTPTRHQSLSGTMSEMSPAAPTTAHTNSSPNGLSDLSSTTGTSVSSAGSPSLSPLDQSQLRAQLMKQMEYYFSRENLNHDTYLVSQMDSDQYVDISIIANFNQVKKLTHDINLIVEVLKESVCVQVDESGQRVRPLHKRSVVILREIPTGTTQEEIEGIFTHSDCPTFASVEYASGDCWYVDFDTEEQAQDAFRFIRETLQTFKGKRIMARIKAKATPVSASSSRPDQRAVENVSTMSADTAARMNSSSTIRYPVPLPHFPLQPPHAYQAGFPMPTPAGHYQFMPYLIASHTWNQPQQLFHQDFAYDMNAYYQTIPHQPPMRDGPPANGGRNGQTQLNQSQSHQSAGERRTHRRGGSNTSDHRIDVSSSTTSHSTTSTGPTSTHAHSNPTKHSVSNPQSNYYNNGGRPRYNKPATGSSSEKVLPNKNWNSQIPPRHKNSKDGYRSAKKYAFQSSQDHQTAHPYQAPPRHQNGAGAGNGTGGNASRNGGVSGHQNDAASAFPHNRHSPSSVNQDMKGAEKSGGASRDYGRNKVHHHAGSEAVPASTHHTSQHNKPHGAHHHQHHHRNSKSPEQDAEPQSAVIKSESFELDSSAFPALPGAISDPAATTKTAAAGATSLLHSPDDKKATSPDGAQSNQDTSKSDANKSATSTVVVTVPKLSDIVRKTTPNLPDASTTKLSNSMKGVSRSAVPVASSNSKECGDQPTVSKGSTVSASHKPQSGAQQQGRPTQLTNGVHFPTSDAKHKAHNSPNSKPVSSSAKHGAIMGSSSNMKKTPSTDKSPTDPKPSGPTPVVTSSSSTSPLDGKCKVSYAAMAQRVVNKTSPVGAESAAPPPSQHGDNNNNASEGKTTPSAAHSIESSPPTSQASNNAAVDNLYSSTAAKNASAVVANGRKQNLATAAEQSRANGPSVASTQKSQHNSRQVPAARNTSTTTHQSTAAMVAR